MAKLERGAKTAAVRQYLATNPQAAPQQVVDDLKAQGMAVKVTLVNGVKYGKKGTGKKLGRRRSANASNAIRAYLMLNPAAMPKEIRAAMSNQGIKASLALISKVKHRLKQAGPALLARIAARRTVVSVLAFEQLVEVKRLADSLGGLDQVRRAVEALEQLR